MGFYQDISFIASGQIEILCKITFLRRLLFFEEFGYDCLITIPVQCRCPQAVLYPPLHGLKLKTAGFPDVLKDT